MTDNKKEMKILITTDLFTTTTNGVVTSVMHLKNGLENRGHEVRILTLSENMKNYRDGSIYYIKSVPLGMIYPNVRMPVSYRNLLIQELIDWKPDIIHSQCEFFSFHFARHISGITGAPIIHTFHTMYDNYVTYVIPCRYLGQRIVRVFVRRRLKNVNSIIVPTNKAKDTLRSYGLSNQIHIVPTGITIPQHKNRMTDKERMEKRRELGIQDSNQVLLSLGRLGTEKNTKELMELFAVLCEINDKLTFLIVGDGPARKSLERLSKKLNIQDKVIFTGMVSSNETQTYYQLGDVFVSASNSETQGLTYIEAAANGLPLLCKKDPCLENVIDEGINGYEYTCSQEFLLDIDIMLKDTKWRSAAGKHSEEIAADFNDSSFACAVEAVYESAIR